MTALTSMCMFHPAILYFVVLVKINGGQEEGLFSIRQQKTSHKVTQVLMQQPLNTKTKLFLACMGAETASDFS